MDEPLDFDSAPRAESHQIRPFRGLLPLTSICVDSFSPMPGASIYFLTHFHADHYAGLSASWNSGVIYCSETTKMLIYQKWPTLKTNIVRSLAYGCWYIPMMEHATSRPTQIQPAEENPEVFKLTLFPAQHCPGSAIFIFEGYFGKYVYTGDMRLEVNESNSNEAFFQVDLDAPEEAAIIPWSKMAGADRLFIDTTFAHTLWEKLPDRIEAISTIIELIESKASPGQTVMLECDMLGTEQVLVGVAEHFGQKLYAESKLFGKLAAIPGLKRHLTSDKQATRFVVAQHGSFSKGNLDRTQRPKDISRSIHSMDALYIKPSTQWFGVKASHKQLDVRQPVLHQGIWHVLYSIHCSFSEIKRFVAKVQPRSIMPLVGMGDAAFQTLSALCPSSSTTTALDPSDVPPRIASLLGANKIRAGMLLKTEMTPIKPRLLAMDALFAEDDDPLDTSLNLSHYETNNQKDKTETRMVDPLHWDEGNFSSVKSLFEEPSEDLDPESSPPPELPVAEPSTTKSEKLHEAPTTSDDLFEAVALFFKDQGSPSTPKRPKLAKMDAPVTAKPPLNLVYIIDD